MALVVEEVLEGVTATQGTTHTITLPTPTAGQLLLIIGARGVTVASVTTPVTLTELLDEAVAHGLYVAMREMDGTEPASYNLTTTVSTRFVWVVYRISGWDTAVTPQLAAATATGTSATPDPPASATPGSAQEYLFIAFANKAGEEADDDTWADTSPTNYTPSPPRQKSGGVAGTNLGAVLCAAERTLTTGSAEDPGTFAVDVSAAWRAQTVMIAPAAAGAVTYEKVGALTAGTAGAGADVAEYAEAGALTSATRPVGADVTEHAETGALTSAARGFAADVYEAAETGSLTTRALAGGTSAKETGGKEGSLTAGGLTAGADASEHAELGSLLAPALSAGVSAKESAGKTGSLTAGGVLAGADAVTYAELGALVAGTFGAGADVFTATETGSLLIGTLVSGVSVYQPPGGAVVAASVSVRHTTLAAVSVQDAAGAQTALQDAQGANVAVVDLVPGLEFVYFYDEGSYDAGVYG